MKVEVRTKCVASSIKLFCLDKKQCGHIDYSSGPAAANIPDTVFEDDGRERSTDYAVNVLYVLAFLASGGGGTEAARLLGLLALPNDTTMESRSFTIIEGRIGYVIRELRDDITVVSAADAVHWKQADLVAEEEENETSSRHSFCFLGGPFFFSLLLWVEKV